MAIKARVVRCMRSVDWLFRLGAGGQHPHTVLLLGMGAVGGRSTLSWCLSWDIPIQYETI